MKIQTFRIPFCLALLSGCASSNNGKTAEPMEAQPVQEADKEPATVADEESPAAAAKDETQQPQTSEQAKLDCEKCNGDWGRHGLARIESCLCRTGDSGKPCKDGDECEGVCLKKDSEFQCSEFVTVFGCYTFLPRGWLKKSEKERENIPTICLD